MKMVCFSSQLGMGKDVASDYICPKLNERAKSGIWQRGAFANAVKEVYCSAFDVDRDFIEKWKRNPEPPPGMLMNIRKSLQFIGDGFRQIKGDIWIEIALRENGKQLVLSDSRYINEAKHAKIKGGINVVLYRPGFLNDDPNPSESQIKPIIEWCVRTQKEGPIVFTEDNLENAPVGIEHYEYYLINDGSIENLYSKLDRLLIPYVERKYSDSAM
jgi:hypothetical protein